MRKRNVHIQFWLDKKEAEAFQKKVKKSGLSREAYHGRVAPAPATTGNRANDTPVQPQSERDKRHFDREAVAGNGGGCERTS